MKSIKFANPIFNHGSNITARRVDRKYTSLRLGSKLSLETVDGEVIEKTSVSMLAAIQSVDKIPDCLLDLEHDRTCRTHEGLLKELKRVYGDWQDDEQVLLIGFELP